MALSPIELRTPVAAQIAAALARGLASNTPDTHVASLAEFAVKIAQAVELAAGRSLTR